MVLTQRIKARTLPLLSGSGANQAIEIAEPLHREAARRTLLELGGGDEALNKVAVDFAPESRRRNQV